MSRLSQTSDLVRDRLAPRAVRPTPVREGLIIFGVCAVIVLARAGSAALHGVIWAEDGAVFLQDAYVGHGWGHVLTGYQGYASVIPRLIASVVSYWPLTFQGFLLNVAAAIVQAAIATFAFHVIRSHTQGRVAAILVVAGVAAMPVGPETVDNICNLQWFLLFAACLAPLWEPRTAVGRAASIGVLCAAAMTSPFGAVAVGVAAVAWLLLRRRDLLVLFVAGTASLLVQVVVMLSAPPRQIPVTPDWSPQPLAEAYLSRVLGDATLGLARYPDGATTSALWPGIGVAAAVALLAVAVGRVRGLGALLLPATTLTLSVLVFVAPMGLGNLDRHVAPAYSGRYSVAPALLFYVAIGVLVERSLLDRRSRRMSGAAAGKGLVAPLAASALVLCLLFGLVSSWSEAHAFRRDRPSWGSEVTHARALCAQAGATAVPLAIAPAGWQVMVPCSRL